LFKAARQLTVNHIKASDRAVGADESGGAVERRRSLRCQTSPPITLQKRTKMPRIKEIAVSASMPLKLHSVENLGH
jgi:hypothetical protein